MDGGGGLGDAALKVRYRDDTGSVGLGIAPRHEAQDLLDLVNLFEREKAPPGRNTLTARQLPVIDAALQGLARHPEQLGVSRKTLERGIDDGKLPGGERVPTGRRLFSLEEIHKIQEILGLMPWRDSKTCLLY